MRRKWNLLFFVLLLSVAMAMLVACGASKSSSSSSGDDDTSDDDDNDDASPDDDDNDDASPDDDDDNDDNDDSSPLPPVTCILSDPLSIAPNTVGGGAVAGGGQVTAYVFDADTCQPIAGATVSVNGLSPVTVDADGMAQVTITTPNTDVVAASAADHWTWAYAATAQSMYFTLQQLKSADDDDTSWSDCPLGSFVNNGSPVSLPNQPITILNITTATIYAGLATPGLSRETLLQTNFNELLSAKADYFPLSYNFGSAKSIDLPGNLDLPNLSLSFLVYGASANHAGFQFPVNSSLSANPMEGAVLSVTVGKAATNLVAVIENIIAHPDELIADLLPIVPDAINKALAFEYLGIDATWDGAGTPALEVADNTSGADSVDVTITNPGADDAYLTVLAGEILNRGIVPLGLQMAQQVEGGSDLAATVTAAPIPSLKAKYLLATVKTNALTILGGTKEPLIVDLAFNFAADLTGLATVPVDGNTSFIADFDATATSYDSATGTVSIGLVDTVGALQPDAYLIIIVPDTGEVGIALVPPATTTFPAADLGITTTGSKDIVVVGALKLPAGTTLSAYDPSELLKYDLPGLNVWTNYDISGLLGL